MVKPVLAILTDTIRYDNQAALRYFTKIKPVHFYKSAPYGDLSRKDLKNTIKYLDFRDLENKLIALKPDIIQGAEPYGSKIQLKLCRIASSLSRKLNIPLIFPMLENRLVKERFGSLVGEILKKILKIYARRASLIFYLNNGAKRNLLEAGVDPQKIKKLLYGIWGIDIDLFKPIKLPPRRWQIGFVGRLDKAKGTQYLLEAWEMVRGDFPNVELVMAGKGELENKVREKEKIRIKYIGVVKNKELPKFFNKVLFSVYPSITLKRWEEQVGMVNLQSLACGTPVITTKSGAIPEYINDKVGILVPEKDSEALAEAMRKLLKNENLRQKLGQNGRQYILENFDAQKTVKKVEEILLGLIKRL